MAQIQIVKAIDRITNAEVEIQSNLWATLRHEALPNGEHRYRITGTTYKHVATPQAPQPQELKQATANETPAPRTTAVPTQKKKSGCGCGK